MNQVQTYQWWQKSIIYQIYPRSFKDSTGDGIGDLKGILEKIDYLKTLGVDAVWISPFFPSPMADFGYDITDYTAIHHLFGDMQDFDALVTELHKRNMKLILDFVPNHTSEEHQWFKTSRQSRNNSKRDWYIWEDPAPDGGPPNNWLSEFGGSAWEYDQKTGQYYYHAYLKEQPDLNWRNPEVREAMMEVLRFWLDKNVDGFRVDVMWHMIKDDRLRDDPPNPDYSKEMSPYKKLLPVFSADQPEVHQVVRQMRQVLEEYGEKVLIGEIYLPVERLVMYYGDKNRGAHLPFNFQLIKLPWDAETIGAAVDIYEGSLPEAAWPNWVLGNHDKSRIATRVGSAQARVAAILLLTLRGTPTMYYGDELGMIDVHISPEQVQDPHEKNVPGKNLGRDPERTPMQWNASRNAGFSDAVPWLPVMDSYQKVNVDQEIKDPASMLNFYRQLIHLRKSEPVLQTGAYYPFHNDQDLLAYVRTDGAKNFLVALNFGQQAADLDIGSGRSALCRLSTHPERDEEILRGEVALQADEGMVLELEDFAESSLP